MQMDLAHRCVKYISQIIEKWVIVIKLQTKCHLTVRYGTY